VGTINAQCKNCLHVTQRCWWFQQVAVWSEADLAALHRHRPSAAWVLVRAMARQVRLCRYRFSLAGDFRVLLIIRVLIKLKVKVLTGSIPSRTKLLWN
jgi:hypothetical protein